MHELSLLTMSLTPGPSVLRDAPGHPDLPVHRAELARARRAARNRSSLLTRFRTRVTGVRTRTPRVV